MRSIVGLLPVCLVLAGCASAGEPGNLAGRLEPLLQRKDVDIAIAYRNLGTGAVYFHHEDVPFHAASTMKLPVMMALFQAVDAGEMRLSEPFAVRNQFQSIVTGSPFASIPRRTAIPIFTRRWGAPGRWRS